MNAAECLLSVGADAAIALECADERLSYAELRAAIGRAAGAWRELGLLPGDRVVVFAPDGIDWVTAYLGAIWAGGVAIGVNARLPMADLGPILADGEVRFVWAGLAEAPAVAGLARTLPLPPEVVAANAVAGCADWRHAYKAASPMPALDRDDDDPALWIGTSGTTGTPKGVIHSQRVVRHAHAFAEGVLSVTASDRLYATSKLFFAYGLGNSLFAGLRRGATVILDAEWPTPERVQELVTRHRPNILFSVPTLYSKMLQAGIAGALAASGIRRFVSAGEAMPASVRDAWTEATAKCPVSGYGTSETLCLMLYCDDESGLFRPTPGTEIRYADDADPAIPQRIWLRAPTVSRGYWRRPEAQADSFRDGWFSPGDMFLRGEDGRLAFTGRSDDLLKISGQWVSTQWIEQTLADACGDVLAQVAAVGAPTPDGLTAVSVLAVAAPRCADEAKRHLDAAVDALPRHRRPRWVFWLDELPLTATGKLQRGRLRALHDAQIARGLTAGV
jgi:acyl-coenzyme A synthetase/AMP-(fatty) acid ligase